MSTLKLDLPQPDYNQLFRTQFNAPASTDITIPWDTQANSSFISSIPDVPNAPGYLDQSWSQRLFGGEDRYGNKWGGALMPAAQLGVSGLNAYLGFKQLGQAEDSLKFQKNAFNKQFENQRTLTNAQLRDRQNFRVSQNTNAMSTDEYMKLNGV